MSAFVLRGGACFAVLSLFCACAAPTGPAPDKASFLAAKADGDVPSERVCVAMGAPPTCDVCRVASWYDDGECDDFCRYRDADCDSTPSIDAEEFRCRNLEESFSDCEASGEAPMSCLPGTADGMRYEAARLCCAFRRDFCEALPDPDESYSPIIQWVRVPYRFRELGAGESGHHKVGAYTLSGFSAPVFAGEMREFDREVWGCDARAYSSSRAAGVAMYEAYVEEHEPYRDGDSYPVDRLLELIRDSENRAVFASVRDGGDAASCEYADFFVFRRDGSVLHLAFDDRDAGADLDDAEGPDGLRYIDEDDLDVVGRMQEYGHNGSSAIGLWSDAALDYETLSTYARVHAAAEYGCVERGISADEAEARERFDAHVRSHFHMSDYFGPDIDAIEEELPGFREDRDLIRRFVEDGSNLSLLSSEFSREGRDYGESCLIYDFYVLRENGTAVRFSVNQTD